MGNYISCTLSAPIGNNSSTAVNVIFPSGEIRRLNELTQAAELMLENSNSFLVNTKSLQIGKRFCALSADEDLEYGNAYVFFPMKRLNGVVLAADLGALFMAANSKKSAKISPEIDRSSEDCTAAKLNLDEIEEFSSPEFKYGLIMRRSKKPLLETIVEEQICLRLLLEIDS